MQAKLGEFMNIKEAMSILGLAGKVTQEQVKKAYRQACSKYHPDRNPGGLEMMKAVNAAYEVLKDLQEVESTEDESNYGEEMNAAINAVIHLEGLIIEICGIWIWLSGKTYPYKEILKETGFKWASNKKMWYFKPEGYKTRSRKEWTADEIRTTYGSKEVKTKGFTALK